MTEPSMLTTKVWNELDPRAGQMTRRGRLTLVTVGLVAVLVVALAAILYRQGSITARISGELREISARSGSRTITMQFRVHNAGTSPVEIIGISSASQAFVVTSASPRTSTIPANRTQRYTAHVHVRVCAYLSGNDAVPLRVVIHHWWGNQTRRLFAGGFPNTGDIPYRACHRHP